MFELKIVATHSRRYYHYNLPEKNNASPGLQNSKGGKKKTNKTNRTQVFPFPLLTHGLTTVLTHVCNAVHIFFGGWSFEATLGRTSVLRKVRRLKQGGWWLRIQGYFGRNLGKNKATNYMKNGWDWRGGSETFIEHVSRHGNSGRLKHHWLKDDNNQSTALPRLQDQYWSIQQRISNGWTEELNLTDGGSNWAFLNQPLTKSLKFMKVFLVARYSITRHVVHRSVSHRSPLALSAFSSAFCNSAPTQMFQWAFLGSGPEGDEVL